MHTGDVPFDDTVDLAVLPTHLADCLRDVKARAIEIEGNHIAFTGGMFRLVSNWNVLVPFGYGDLTVDASTRQVHYRLSSRQLVIPATVLTIVLAIFGIVQMTASRSWPWQPTRECCDSAAAELGGLWRASGGTSFAVSNRSLSPSECTVNRRIRCPKIRPPLQV